VLPATAGPGKLLLVKFAWTPKANVGPSASALDVAVSASSIVSIDRFMAVLPWCVVCAQVFCFFFRAAGKRILLRMSL
jgi:hypothetical protein